MESQLQYPEFRNNPKNLHPYMQLFDLALIVCLEVKVDCCFVCDLTSQSTAMVLLR